MHAYRPSVRSAAFATAIATLLAAGAFFAFVFRSLRQQGRRNLVFRKRREPLVKFASDFKRSAHSAHGCLLSHRCAEGLRGAPRGDAVMLRLLNRSNQNRVK